MGQRVSLAKELQKYRVHWYELTGHEPSAIPMTSDECKVLWKEIMGEQPHYVVLNEEAVPTVFGMDIYITPDAAERRAQILEKK